MTRGGGSGVDDIVLYSKRSLLMETKDNLWMLST